MAALRDARRVIGGANLSIKTIINGIVRLAFVLVLLSVPLGLGAAPPSNPSVAVIYPDIREPFKGVFLQIIGGIDEVLKTPVKRYELNESNNVAAIESQLVQDHIDALIVLGRASVIAVEKMQNKWPTIVGAVSAGQVQTSRDFAGITLIPDPDMLFQRLKSLAPNIKRVTVIYGSERGPRAMEQAADAAKAHGLVLNALPAENLKEAATLYRSFLSESAADSDALWLLQDGSALDENTLLLAILKDAWEKNLVVFSSSPEHVKKGALFSLFPNNQAMGRSLATLTLGQLQEAPNKRPTMQPLRDLLIAINLRTAEHLGLRLQSHDMRKFDLVFPSP